MDTSPPDTPLASPQTTPSKHKILQHRSSALAFNHGLPGREIPLDCAQFLGDFESPITVPDFLASFDRRNAERFGFHKVACRSEFGVPCFVAQVHLVFASPLIS